MLSLNTYDHWLTRVDDLEETEARFRIVEITGPGLRAGTGGELFTADEADEVLEELEAAFPRSTFKIVEAE